MKKKLYKIKCHLCNGTGKRTVLKRIPIHTTKEMKRAFELYNKMSLRAVAKKMGIKHPQTVKWLIESYLNRK